MNEVTESPPPPPQTYARGPACNILKHPRESSFLGFDPLMRRTREAPHCWALAQKERKLSNVLSGVLAYMYLVRGQQGTRILARGNLRSEGMHFIPGYKGSAYLHAEVATDVGVFPHDPSDEGHCIQQSCPFTLVLVRKVETPHPFRSQRADRAFEFFERLVKHFKARLRVHVFGLEPRRRRRRRTILVVAAHVRLLISHLRVYV